MTRSPLVELPGAVAAEADGADAGVAAHYGDPLAEQRRMDRAAGVVDRSHRSALAVTGQDRLSWLHLLLSQHVAELPDGAGAEALVLDAHGRVEHHVVLSHVAGCVWLDTEPGRGAPLLSYLDSMRFWSDVALREVSGELAVLSVVGPATPDVLTAADAPVPDGAYASTALPGGGLVRRMPWPGRDAADLLVPREALAQWWIRLREAGAAAAGIDAFEALRVAALRPRLGRDTDERTIPHEVGWIGSAVHLTKGCYRGQETISRVSNVGRPPRRMLLLHLASADLELPAVATAVRVGARAVGRVGTAVRHHELGAVALTLLKSSVSPAAALEVDGIGPVAVDPDSVPPETGEPPGRAAMRRLKG